MGSIPAPASPPAGQPAAGPGLTPRILAPGDPALDSVGLILADRFPAGERDDWAHLCARHAEGRLVIAVSEQRGGPAGAVPAQPSTTAGPRLPRPRTGAETHVGGAAVVALLPRTESAALLYLAAARNAPTAGVGLQLMAHLRIKLPSYGVRRGFMGEVERVEDATDAADAHQRRRRLRYYQRFGAQLVRGIPGYGMPDMTTGALLPLHLVWLPAATPVDEVRGRLLHDLVTELYEVAYERPADDPLLGQVLATTV